MIGSNDDEDDAKCLLPGVLRKATRQSILRPKSTQASKKFSNRQEPPCSSNKDHSDGDDLSLDSSTDLGTSRGLLIPVLTTPKLLLDTCGTTHRAEALKFDLPPVITPLPSYYHLSGPGDSWTCPFDGCNHNIYDARTPESIDMIESHFIKIHAGNAEDLINQESRPWASVDNLLARVKGIASSKAKGASEQPGFPARVIRRY